MPRSLKPASHDNVIQAENALACLRQARNWLRNADSPRSLARVLAAIKSTEGAIRHLGRRVGASAARPAELTADMADYMRAEAAFLRTEAETPWDLQTR